MQMIQMARETNCHSTDATTSAHSTSTPANCDHQLIHCNNRVSSNLFSQTAASEMGLLSISLDGKANCDRESSVISPSCQAVSCIQQQQQQQQQQQRPQHQLCPRDSSPSLSPIHRGHLTSHGQESVSSLHVKCNNKQQETSCSIVQGKVRRQLDDQSVICKPSMSFTSYPTFKSSCKQQLSGKYVTSTTNHNVSGNVPEYQVVINNAPVHMSESLIKSSANSGYCSSFGSSSTSFFDDEDTTSQTCDNSRQSDHDNNIDADGVVDHVVADAGEDDTEQVVNCTHDKYKRNCNALQSNSEVTHTENTSVGKSNIDTMDQIASNLSNTTIDDGDSCKDSSSNCTNNNYNNITGDDDDSHAYPIIIECGSNELTLMVEENLTAAYLVNILLLKFSLDEDVSWTLFMKITVDEKSCNGGASTVNLQCMIEDFEEVVPLVLKYQSFASDIRLILRQALDKLTMYNNLPSYFDLNMIDLGEYGRVRSSSISFTNTSTHSNRSNSFDGSNGSIRKPTVSNSCSNEFQQLQRFLLISDTFDLIVSSPVKLIRSSTSSSVESHSAVLEKTQLTLSHVNSMCRDIIDFRSNRYDLFTCFDETVSGENCFYLVSPNEKCPMYKIVSSNSSTALCWISCLRLAKIGMQNMRRYIKSYKSSQNIKPVHNHSRHGSFGSKGCNVPFTPSSPPSIASFNATSSSSCRQNNHNGNPPSLTSPSSSSSSTFSSQGPWFYENLTREQASKLLSQYLSINGVFLVRQSTRAPGTYVLSLVLNRKILHIIVMSMQIDPHTCYLTLDQGKTKFADLSQLIQFYQLNHSLLGCKLTHYVTRR